MTCLGQHLDPTDRHSTARLDPAAVPWPARKETTEAKAKTAEEEAAPWMVEAEAVDAELEMEAEAAKE